MTIKPRRIVGRQLQAARDSWERSVTLEIAAGMQETEDGEDVMPEVFVDLHGEVVMVIGEVGWKLSGRAEFESLWLKDDDGHILEEFDFSSFPERAPGMAGRFLSELGVTPSNAIRSEYESAMARVQEVGVETWLLRGRFEALVAYVGAAVMRQQGGSWILRNGEGGVVEPCIEHNGEVSPIAIELYKSIYQENDIPGFDYW